MCHQNVSLDVPSTDRVASGLGMQTIFLRDSWKDRCSYFGRMLSNKKLTSRSRLGFIGLGHLGSPIARRLVAAGFPMVVYDRDPTKTADLINLGANASSHPRILASEVDVVLSCLPDEPSVEDAYLRTGDVLHSAQPG